MEKIVQKKKNLAKLLRSGPQCPHNDSDYRHEYKDNANIDVIAYQTSNSFKTYVKSLNIIWKQVFYWEKHHSYFTYELHPGYGDLKP